MAVHCDNVLARDENQAKHIIHFFFAASVCCDCIADEIACENIHTVQWKKRLCLLIQIMFMFPLSELMRASFNV